MVVRFKDTEAEVTDFSFRGTYDGCMEGTRKTVSTHIIEGTKREMERWGKEGRLNLYRYQDEEKTELMDWQFSLYVKTDYIHDLHIEWYGDAPSESETIKEIIEKITAEIEFNANCRVIDLDNF